MGIIALQNESVEGKGHKYISKVLKRKYLKTLPLKITFRKPETAKLDRRKSEPLTPSMESEPLTPKLQKSARTVSMNFNVRTEHLLQSEQFPHVAVSKKNKKIEFKRREYPKHETKGFNKRKYRVRKPNGSEIIISESNSDGLLFGGCAVSMSSGEEKDAPKGSEIVKKRKKKKKKARPRSDSAQ